MYSNYEHKMDHMSHRSCELKAEQLLSHSHIFLTRLCLLKNQLHDIDRSNQKESYDTKLNEIKTIVHNLSENILNIEQLHSQLSEDEHLKFDHEIDLLRTEVDLEMTELYRLNENFTISSRAENESSSSSSNKIDDNDTISNELRQRQITKNHLNDSYDLLEQDLANLRETMDEVATIIYKQNQQTKSIAKNLEYIARYPIDNASSFYQKASQKQYFSLAPGAIIGASIAGPIGFMMGAKIGTLVTLSGSVVGALSLKIMHQRVVKKNELQNNDTIAYNQAML